MANAYNARSSPIPEVDEDLNEEAYPHEEYEEEEQLPNQEAEVEPVLHSIQRRPRQQQQQQRLSELIVLPDQFMLEVEVRSGQRSAEKKTLDILVKPSEENWTILKERIKQKFMSENFHLKYDFDFENIENFKIRPATRARQAAFWQVDPQNIMGQFERVYTNIQSGGRLPRGWVFRMTFYVSVKRRVAPRLRVSAAMVNSAAEEVNRFAEVHGRRFGRVEGAYMSRTVARRGGDAEAEIANLIENPTPMHRMIQRFDELPRLNNNPPLQGENDEEETIDVPVQFLLRIPKRSFLMQIGLPETPLIRSFDRPTPPEEHLVPADALENQEDVDHMDEFE
jgi:hypothetical protein